MAINVTLGEVKTQEEKPFPKLMIYVKEGRKTIVHFKEYGKIGIQVFSDSEYNKEIQMIESDGWSIEKFTDYNEPITLQNAQHETPTIPFAYYPVILKGSGTGNYPRFYYGIFFEVDR